LLVIATKETADVLKGQWSGTSILFAVTPSEASDLTVLTLRPLRKIPRGGDAIGSEMKNQTAPVPIPCLFVRHPGESRDPVAEHQCFRRSSDAEPRLSRLSTFS